MKAYSGDVERHMQLLYDSLSEKDRRRYAAVEAEKLGHGGDPQLFQFLGGVRPLFVPVLMASVLFSKNTAMAGIAHLSDVEITQMVEPVSHLLLGREFL